MTGQKSGANRPAREVHLTLGSHMDLFWMGAARDCLDRGSEIIKAALDLCRAHPDYCFYIETTVFAEHFLKLHPEDKDCVAELLANGRLEIGASYADRVEHMHGGESILRHHVHAIRWMMTTFGRRPASTCHSDLPGLSPQVPQICSLCGIDFYLRARGPCSVSRWRAPDGSEVIYGSFGYGYGRKSADDVEEALAGVDPGLPAVLLRGGYSDLEMADANVLAVVDELRRRAGGATRFSISSPAAALDRYVRDPDAGAKLPVISGEWPFGWGSAATIEVENFQANIDLERLLLAAEKLAAAARMCGHEVRPPGPRAHWWTSLGRYAREILPVEIPRGEELVEAWKAELFTQDHNYGGFSAARSEFDRRVMLSYASQYVQAIAAASMSDLAAHVEAPGALGGRRVLAFAGIYNPMSWARADVVAVDLPADLRADSVSACLADGRPLRQQQAGGAVAVSVPAVPGLCFLPLYFVERPPDPARAEPPSPVFHESPRDWERSFRRWQDALPARQDPWILWARRAGETVIDTGRFRVSLDEAGGTIGAIHDKGLRRQLVDEEGARGFLELLAYEDPGIDVRYSFTGRIARDSETPCRLRMESRGDVSATWLFEGELEHARVEKRITLYREMPVLDMSVTIYWWGKKGDHVRLCLPFSRSGFEATWYGVPFHAMQWPRMMEGIADDAILGMGRARHDEMQAEDRRHFREVKEWVDVGYSGCGVCVGTRWPTFWIDGSLLEIPLIRCQRSCGDHNHWPLNPGRHTWQFRIAPHEGDWRAGRAYRTGWEFAHPSLVGPVSRPGAAACAPTIPAGGASVFSVEADNAVVSAIKPAYDGSDACVVRLFEAEGRPAQARLGFARDIAEAAEVNLLEEPLAALTADERDARTVRVALRPHEIKTVKIRWRAGGG